MQNRILVTGATGNVGGAVLRNLKGIGAEVVCASYNPGREQDHLVGETLVELDFMRPETLKTAFAGIDSWFLMRPPQISDTEKYLFPAIDAAIEQGVRRIVFLSLLGIENNTRVPHWPVEAYLRTKDIEWTMVRPSFFMQNLSTTHREEISKGEIFLPVGKGRTSFIDVDDIGAVIAKCLLEDGHAGKAYEITGPEALDYEQVAEMYTQILGKNVTYKDPSLIGFLGFQLRHGRKLMHALVMCFLYLQTKRGMADVVTDQVERLAWPETRHDEGFHRCESGGMAIIPTLLYDKTRKL